uniref:Uncharacterized protein n=1 Tax=Panagrolaimus sp. JU765 TaxID=591449 RepID=A0AC34Q030_9BILA
MQPIYSKADGVLKIPKYSLSAETKKKQTPQQINFGEGTKTSSLMKLIVIFSLLVIHSKSDWIIPKDPKTIINNINDKFEIDLNSTILEFYLHVDCNQIMLKIFLNETTPIYANFVFGQNLMVNITNDQILFPTDEAKTIKFETDNVLNIDLSAKKIQWNGEYVQLDTSNFLSAESNFIKLTIDSKADGVLKIPMYSLAAETKKKQTPQQINFGERTKTSSSLVILLNILVFLFSKF